MTKSFLHRAIRKPLPVISRCNGNYYLKYPDSGTYSEINAEEEALLVRRILHSLTSKHYLDYVDVRNLAISLQAERVVALAGTSADENERKRLKGMKFSQHWYACFVARHKNSISRNLSRGVDKVRELAFNGETLAIFFAQVEYTFSKYKIVHASQVLNLDGSGFSPGRDAKGASTRRVVTRKGDRAVQARVRFRYEHRITILLCVAADGTEYLPAVVFKGAREPFLSDHVSRTRVSQIVPPTWACFWRKELGSVATRVFNLWVKRFVSVVRSNETPKEWKLLFNDGLRSHMTAYAIKILKEAKIAVVALPAHTSDRLQPLDVIVFGPMKH